jgi:hypothetical protein
MKMVRHIKVAVIITISLLSCWAASAQVQFSNPTAFTTGTEPSVAITTTGLVLEVHQSGDETSFMFGQLSGQAVTWGPSKTFPWKMYNVRVNKMDVPGSSFVTLSYTGEPFGGGCFYRVASIDTGAGLDGGLIWRTGEEKWGTCDYTLDSRIVFNSTNVVGVYSDSSHIFYRTGTFKASSARISFPTDPVYLSEGRDVDVALSQTQIVEMNDKPGGILESRPARNAASILQTVWGHSVHLPTNGFRGHATMYLKTNVGPGSVVAIYYKAPLGLYTMTGRYQYGRSADLPSIEWISPEGQVFPRPVANSDLANTGTQVIEVHEYQGKIYYSVGAMPAPSVTQTSTSSTQDNSVPDGQ